ncbi:retrovirus-related pol polyprotein from transposon TNT 1-94 [Tanacetum coccineum]
MKDKVVQNNSQVKSKKIEVEDHHRISSISNKTKSITACIDSLKSRISNVNAVCATCEQCVFNSNHDACVSKFLNDVNARTKKPKLRPISTRQPKSQANKFVATPPKKTIVQLILFIVDSGCTKHMMGNLKLLCNFVEKYLVTVRFRNDQFALLLGYGDLVQRNIMINKGNYLLTVSPTQAWLWHRRLSHLNFDYINLLSKKDIVIGLPKLKYVKDQLSQVITVQTDRGTKFLNKTLHAYFKEEGIEHQTSTPRTHEQNDVVERRNRTLVETARTMLSAYKLPLFFWAEAIATACYTQNRSIIIPTHEKTAYHIINNMKPSIRHLHIFSCTCYLTRDGENLDKMKEKGDPCILVGYST